jgi:rfaE bifunctional protein kinase chain/domain
MPFALLDRQRLPDLIQSFRGKRIAVVGDLMVDRYYWGTVKRVSPEAPVPVVEVESEQTRLGGAANVANNIQSLGGQPLLVGLIGNDHPGQILMDLLRYQNFATEGIVVDGGRPTTIKTRVIAQGQHVVRIDNESKTECPDHLRAAIVDAVRYRINSIDGIILEDYNKGVLSGDVIADLIGVARKYNKVITVDPKFEHFLDYRDVTVFKPNRRETEEILGGRVRNTEEVEDAGRKLLKLLQAQNVLLTRSEDGMSLFENGGTVTHIPSVANNVQDVSGAGDTVIATLTMALVSGTDVRQACVLANCASGVVVGHVGIVPIQPTDLLEAAQRCITLSTGPH